MRGQFIGTATSLVYEIYGTNKLPLSSLLERVLPLYHRGFHRIFKININLLNQHIYGQQKKCLSYPFCF